MHPRDQAPFDPADAEALRFQSLNTTSVVSYLLHTVVAIGALVPGGQWGPLLLLVALVIDMYKRSDAADTWYASHFSWRLRSVFWAGVAYIVTIPLWFLFLWPGWLAWLLVSLWFLIRVVRGFLGLNAGKTMPI